MISQNTSHELQEIPLRKWDSELLALVNLANLLSFSIEGSTELLPDQNHFAVDLIFGCRNLAELIADQLSKLREEVEQVQRSSRVQ
ncbi:MAG: hypothetical protein AAFX78_01970 [Cyanobacteria bacterium J06638_20]